MVKPDSQKNMWKDVLKNKIKIRKKEQIKIKLRILCQNEFWGQWRKQNKKKISMKFEKRKTRENKNKNKKSSTHGQSFITKQVNN